MQWLLIGNYGVGNLGDEMLKEYFLRAFAEVEWNVVAENSQLPRLPCGLRSFCTTPWWKTLSALRKSDGIVFGGGTLYTDIESVEAPLLWWWHVLWARLFRKRIVIAFQGVGPFRTRIGEWCGRWAVERAELVIVRDQESWKRIFHWKNKNCVQSFDPVLSLFHEEKHSDRSQKVFIIIPRANSPESFLSSVRELYEHRRKECPSVRIVSLESHHPAERLICQRLSREFQAPIAMPRDRIALEHALKDAAFVCTQRYHGAVAAIGMGIPFVTIPQTEKDKLATIGHLRHDEALRLVKEGEAALRSVFCYTQPYAHYPPSHGCRTSDLADSFARSAQRVERGT